MKKIISSQYPIIVNSCNELSKTWFFLESTIKGHNPYSECHSELSLVGMRLSGLKKGFSGPLWLWRVDIFRGTSKLFLQTIFSLLLGHFIAQECGIYVLGRFLICKFLFHVLSSEFCFNFVLRSSLILKAILHETMKTSKFWKFFVSSVIYFIKYLVLHYSLSWVVPRSPGVTFNKYSPVIIYWEIVTSPLVNKYSLQKISTPLETV